MKFPLSLACCFACLPLFSCSPSNPPTDANDDAADAASADSGQCTESTAVHSVYPSPLYVRVGSEADVALRLERDRLECAARYTITSEDPSVASAPESVSLGLNESLVRFKVRGVRAGRVRIRVAQQGATSDRAAGVTEVTVLGGDVPACPMNTQTITGMLGPGRNVTATAGSPLAAASVGMPTTVNAPTVPVTMACAGDQIPEGFQAIGPAVRFGPEGRRFPREIPFQVPINPALVPSMYELQVEVSYSAPGGLARPRIVPVANLRFSSDGRSLTFVAPRLGVYQAVIRQGLGTRRVRRRFTYRALMGFSMGAIGTSSISMRHPELFDFIMPLGGAADWAWFTRYAREFMFGGFCTAEQRTMLGDACNRASNDRTPTPDDFWMQDQNFEWFYYPDEVSSMGIGGNFDRRSYTQIFRDLAAMGGNPFMQSDPANRVLPQGVPATELMRSDAERCAQPVVLQNYFDDEFNPDGSLPVVTFCDGTNNDMHIGQWDGTRGNIPFEVSLAVDINRNGRRDYGEPVLRNFYEPFRDVGTDGLANIQEPGFHPENNPDPNGDDYDRQYNPGGTEGNYVYNMGEPFDDVGLDGIRCPAGRTCPHDQGEGNGRFDANSGLQNMLENSPRARLAAMNRNEVHRLGIWADGGTRDLFSFGTSANHWVGAAAQQGESVHYFNNFYSLQTGRELPPNSDEGFNHTNVDYEHLPQRLMLRYGFEDASMPQVILGDGAHVGTVEQATNRFFTSVWWLASRWPALNRSTSGFSSMLDDAGRCTRGYTCTFEFRSPRTNRTGPVSIYLPPGYHRPENQSQRYPVLFVLHGYGMEPQQLLGTGLLIGNFMATGNVASWQRPGKMIMVFPDGRCRPGDGCPRGTFYLDSPNASRGQIETYFLDLYNFIGTNFRTRAPEEIEVVE